MKWHKRYKIVSFYTPDYEPYADILRASIKRHLPGVQHEIEPISQRKWVDATCFKGEFVRDKLLKSDRPVVWIDADAEILTSDLRFPDVDFAIYSRFASKLRAKWSPFRTGTVYFGKTEDGLDLARAWANECRMRVDGIDQWALFNAWAQKMFVCELPATVWLPLEFCRKKNEEGPVKIRHDMASRTQRRKK